MMRLDKKPEMLKSSTTVCGEVGELHAAEKLIDLLLSILSDFVIPGL